MYLALNTNFINLSRKGLNQFACYGYVLINGGTIHKSIATV